MTERIHLGSGIFNITPPVNHPFRTAEKVAIQHAEPVGGFVNDNVMVTSSMLCLEDGARARELMLGARGHYHQGLLYRYLDTFPSPAGTPEWPELGPPLTAAEVEMAVQVGEWAIGDPDEVSRVVQRWEDVGADQLTFGMLSQELPIEEVVAATELFGREVIPRFDTEPDHRTVRLRREQATVAR
ncbi:hypothetical protein [Iamia sp.]|uniref:hypothetical protein n=1 Tax=Iamia sp. TaxID=2722710 RepID=UPI002D1AF28F|nr:hypothetical protein [Iamia sp.]HXH55869.1 hypothetical protein [Iamia sp.]